MSTLTNNYEHFEESEDDSNDDIVSNDDSDSEESEDESSEGSNSEESEEETGDENEDIHIKSGTPNDVMNNSDENGEKESCPVCLCQFIGQDLGTPENCTHTFCLECILEWSKNINTCPIDRNEFNNIHLRSTPDGKVLKKIKIEVKPKEPEGALQEDTTVCEVCHSGEREDRLLLCDACDLAYHCECLNPPLFHIPIEEWFCPPCARVLRTGAMAGCSTPRLRRVIPRTRASETVRTRVQNLRTTGSQPSTSASLNSPKFKVKTPQRRRRRTYGRSYKKVVQLARTKKNLMDGGKGKGLMKGSTVIVTYRRKSRRRRRKTKARSKKIKVSATESAYIKSTQDRISKRLGLVKPTKGVFIPEVKSKASKSSLLDNQRKVSLFGSKDELIDFNENEEDKPGPSNPSGSSKKSSSSPNKVRPIPEASTSSLNLLDSIMASQTLLHSKPDNVIIRTDGSLALKKSSNEPSSYSKKSNESSKSQVPSSSKSYTSTAKNGAIPKSKTVSFKNGTSAKSSEFKSPFNILRKKLISNDNKNSFALTKHKQSAESNSKFIETSVSSSPVKDKSISMSAARRTLWKSSFDNQGVDKPFQDPISETDNSQSMSKSQKSSSQNYKSIKSDDDDESNQLSPDYIRKKRLLFYSRNIVSVSKYEANIHNDSEKLEKESHEKSSKKDKTEYQTVENVTKNSLIMNNSCSYLSENTIKALEVLSTDDEDVEDSQSLIQSVPNSYTEQLGEKVVSNTPIFNVLETNMSEEDLDFNESQSLIDLPNDCDKFQSPNQKIRIKKEISSDEILNNITNDQHENTRVFKISRLNHISTDNPKDTDSLKKTDLCKRSSIEEIKVKDEPQDDIDVPNQDKSSSKSIKSLNQNLLTIKEEPFSSDEEDTCSSRRFLKPMPYNLQNHLFESNCNNSENLSIEELPATQPNVNLSQKEILSKNGDLNQEVTQSGKLFSQTQLNCITSQSSDITNASKVVANAKSDTSLNYLQSTELQKTTFSSNQLDEKEDNHSSSSGIDVFLTSKSNEKDNPTALPVASKSCLQNTNDQDLKSSANQLISLMNNADFVRQLSQSQILTLVTNIKNHLSLQKNSNQSVIKNFNSDSNRVSENKIASSKIKAKKVDPESNLPTTHAGTVVSLNDTTNTNYKNMMDIHEKQTVSSSATAGPKARINLKLEPHTLQSTDDESELDLPATQPMPSSHSVSNPYCENLLLSSQEKIVKINNLPNTCPESGNGSKSNQQLLQSTAEENFLNLPATQCLSSDARTLNNDRTIGLETNSRTTEENSNNKFDQPETQPFLIDGDDCNQTCLKTHSKIHSVSSKQVKLNENLCHEEDDVFEFPETQPFVISENMCDEIDRNCENISNVISKQEQNKQSKANNNIIQADSTKQKSICDLNKFKNSSVRENHLSNNDTCNLPATQPITTINYEKNLNNYKDEDSVRGKSIPECKSLVDLPLTQVITSDNPFIQPENQISPFRNENDISSIEKNSSSYEKNNLVPCRDINYSDFPSTQPAIQTKISSLKIIKICNEIPENSSSDSMCRDLPPTQLVAVNAKTNNIKSSFTKNNLLSSTKHNKVSDISESESAIFDKNKANVSDVEIKQQSLPYERESGSIKEIKLAEQKKYRKLSTFSYNDKENSVDLLATQPGIVQKSINTCSNTDKEESNVALKFKNITSNSSEEKEFIGKIKDPSYSNTSNICLNINENSNVELYESVVLQNTLRKEPIPYHELCHPLDAQILDLPDNISECEIDKINYQKEAITSDSSETEEDIFDDLPPTQLPFDRLPLMRTVENIEETKGNMFDELPPTQLTLSDDLLLKETVENKRETYEDMYDLPATQLAVVNNESSLKQTVQNTKETEENIFDLPPTQLALTADESSLKQTVETSKEAVENGFDELPPTQLSLSSELFLKQVDQNSKDAVENLFDDLPATQLAIENHELSLKQSVIKTRIVQNIFDLPPTQLAVNTNKLSLKQTVESNREAVENMFDDLPPTQLALIADESSLKQTVETSKEAVENGFDELPPTQLSLSSELFLKQVDQSSKDAVENLFDDLPATQLAIENHELSLKQSVIKTRIVQNIFDLPPTQLAVNTNKLSFKQTVESNREAVENMFDDLPPTQLAVNTNELSLKQTVENNREAVENMFDDLPPTQLVLSNKLTLKKTGENSREAEKNIFDDLPATQLAIENNKSSLKQYVGKKTEMVKNIFDIPSPQLAFNNDKLSLKQTVQNRKEMVENMSDLPLTQLAINTDELAMKQTVENSREAVENMFDDLPPTQIALNNDKQFNKNKKVSSESIFDDLPPTQPALNDNELLLKKTGKNSTETEESRLDDLPPTQLVLSNKLTLKKTGENSREAEKNIFDDLPATQLAIENNKSSLKQYVRKKTEMVKNIFDIPSPQLAFNNDKLSLKQTVQNRKEMVENMSDLPLTQLAINTDELAMKQTVENSREAVENMFDDLPPTQIALNNDKQFNKNKKVSSESIFDDLPPTQPALNGNELLLKKTGKNSTETEESRLDDLPPTQLALNNDKGLLEQTVENSRKSEESMSDLPPTQQAYNDDRLLFNQTVENNKESEESWFDNLPPTQLALDNNKLLLNTVENSRETEGNMLDLPPTQLAYDNNRLSISDTNNKEAEENVFDDLPPTQLALNNEELLLNAVENKLEINRKIIENMKISLCEAKNLEHKQSPKKVGIHKNLPQVIMSKPSRLVPTPKPINRKTFSFDFTSKQAGYLQEERNAQSDVINDNAAQINTQLSGKSMDKLNKSRDSNKVEKMSNSRSRKEFCDSDMHVATKNHECVKENNGNSKLNQNMRLTDTETKQASSSNVSRAHKKVQHLSKPKSKENLQNANNIKTNQGICERQESNTVRKERKKDSEDLRKLSKKRSLGSNVSLEKKTELTVSSKYMKNEKQISSEVKEKPHSKNKDWSDNESISGKNKKLSNEHKNRLEYNNFSSNKNTSSNSNQKSKEIERKKQQLIESEKIKRSKFDSANIKNNYIKNNEKYINIKQSSKETIPGKIKRQESNSSITNNEITANNKTSSSSKTYVENKNQQQEKWSKKKNQELDNSLNTNQNKTTDRKNSHDEYDKKDKQKHHVENFEKNKESPSKKHKSHKWEKHKKIHEYKGSKRPLEEIKYHNEYDIPPKNCVKKNKLDKSAAKDKEEINKHLRKSKIDSVEHINKREKCSKSHLAAGKEQYNIDTNKKIKYENIQKLIKKEKLDECIDYSEIEKRIKKETFDISEANSLPPFCDNSRETLLSPSQIKQEPLDETEFNFEESFTNPVMRELPSRFRKHSQRRKTAVVSKPVLSVDNVSGYKKKDNFEATVVEKNVKVLKVPPTKRKSVDNINCDIQKKQKCFDNKSSQNNPSSKVVDGLLLKKFPKVAKAKNTPSKKVKSKTNVLDVLNKAADDIIKNSSYKVTHESLSINGRFEFEVVKDSPNSISSESKERKISKKQDLKEEIAVEVKKVLKPFYSVGVINKDDYKDIMRRAVPKIFMNCNNIINPEKIKKLVLNYVSMLKTS